jgi:hypothetical protein
VYLRFTCTMAVFINIVVFGPYNTVQYRTYYRVPALLHPPLQSEMRRTESSAVRVCSKSLNQRAAHFMRCEGTVKREMHVISWLIGA